MLSKIKTKIHMGFFTFLGRCKVAFFALALLSSTMTAWAQCPTVDNATPLLCDSADPTVASLNGFVTDGGAGIAWYAADNGGTALNQTTKLTSGTTYFVDNATGDCGARQGVTVTVTVVNKPVATNVAWGLCRESTTVLKTLQDGINLDVFVGDDSALRYYADEFTATPMALTDQLTAGSFVWAAAVDGVSGCESKRQAVIVVYIDAIMPVGNSPQAFCIQDGVTHTIASIVTDTGNTFYLDNNPLSTNVPGTTPLQNGATYYISNRKPGCESARLPVLVNLVNQLDAGESASVNICVTDIGNQPPLDLFAQLTGNPLTTGSWTDPQGVTIPGGHNPAAVDITGLPEGPHVYTYSLPAAIDPLTDPCPPPSSTVTVNVVPEANAGQSNNNIPAVCSNAPAFDLFALIGGTPDAGGAWSPALNSGGNDFTPGTDAAGVYTYTVDNGVCPPVSSQLTVAVEQAPDAGSSSILSFCESEVASQAPFNLIDRLTGAPTLGGEWTTTTGVVIANGDQGTIDISGLDATGSPYVFTYTVLGTPICPAPAPSTVTIEIEAVRQAGQDGATIVCSNEGIVDLFTRLPGNPSQGGTWSGPSVLVNGMFDQTIHLPGVYSYTVDNNICVDDVSNLTVTLGNFVDPGIGRTLNFCENNDGGNGVSNQPPLDLWSQLTGTPDAGGTWTNPQGGVIAGGNQPAPVDISGLGVGAHNFTYTTTGDCNNTSVVVVQVDPIPFAGGTPNAPFARCSNEGMLTLIDLLPNNPQQGGQWTFNGVNVDPIIDLSTAQSGTYSYTVTSLGCNLVDVESLVLNITPSLSTGSSSTLNFCFEELSQAVNVVLFNELGGTPDVGGTWNIPPTANGVSITDGHLGTISIRGLSAGDYAFTYSFSGDCPSPPSTVTIRVERQLSAGEQDNPVTICTGEGTVNLLSMINGNPDPGGRWTFNGNQVSGQFNAATSPAGVYTYTQLAGSCSVAQVSTVTVTIGQSPDPGQGGQRRFCVTDLGSIPVFDLFDEVSGTPQQDGTWSSNTGIAINNGHRGTVDINSLSGAGTYTFDYTVPPTADCPEESTSVTIVIDPLPEAGDPINNGAAHVVCESGSSFNLMTLLSNNAQLGGQWTDVDNGNAFVPSSFNPSIGPGTYNYVYTVTSIGCNLSDSSNPIQVVVEPAPNAGQNGGDIAYCISDLANQSDLTLFNELNGTPQPGGTWTDSQGQILAGGHLATVSVATLTGAQNVYTYTVPSTNNSCTDASATVNIRIDPLPDAGDPSDPSGTTTKCSSDAPFDLMETLTADAQPGGTWTDLNGSPISNMFNPGTAIVGTTYKFRYTVNSIACGFGDTRIVNVRVTQGPNAGTSTIVEFCEGELAGLGAYNILGALGANVDQNGTWDNPSVVNNRIDLTGATVGSTVYTYTVRAGQGSTCVDDVKTVTIVIQPVPEAGRAVLPVVPVCSTEAAFSLMDLLTADNGVNPVAGGVWTNSSGNVVNGMFDPSIDSDDVFTYTVTSSSCSVATQQVSVTILVHNNPPQVTSFASSGNVCSGNPAEVTIQGTANAVVTIDYAGNTSGAQQVTLTGGTGTFQTFENVSADTQFTISSIAYAGPKGCPQVVNANNTAIVTVEQTPTATISGSSTICSGSASTIIFGGTVGATVTYTRSDVQGNQQITLTGGAADTITPSPSLTTTTTFTLVSVTSPAGCSDNSLNGSAVVTVLSPSTANLDSQNTLTACRNSSPTLNITGATPNATITYTRTDDVGTDYTVTTDGTGALTSPITINNIQNNVTVTLTKLDVTTNGLTCSTVITNQTQTIVVSQQPTAGVLTTTAAQFNNSVCSGGNVGIQFTGGTAGAVVTYQVLASDGVTQIGQDRSVTLLNNGTYSGTSDISNITQGIIIRITKVTQGCENNSPGIVDLPIAVTVPPVIANAKVSVQSNGSICFGTTATVDITDASSLPDATYDVTYVLSGDNSNGAGTIVAVTFNGGAGSFVIPTNQLANAGSTDVQIQSINLGNGCDIAGATFNDNDATITVHALVPDLTRSTSDLYLCVLDGQTFTFNDLKSEFTVGSGFEIIWYDSSGVQKTGVGIPDSKVTNGVYFAELINSSSNCPSPNRFQLNVFIDKCHSAPNVVTPNSPNVGGPGTGATDANVFQIYDIQFLFPNYSYDVYNRYGVKLFTGDINNPIWDGKSTEGNLGVNEVVPTGVYYYVINFNDGKSKPEQGYFYLSR